MTALIVALVVTGTALLVVEAHVATFGVLGASGLAAIAAAAVLALEQAGAGAGLALAVVLPVLAVLAGLGAIAARKTLQAHRRVALGGRSSVVGHVGVVRRAVAPVGQVAVRGELWRARRAWSDDEADAPLEEGAPVVVEGVQGLTVSVRRAEEWELVP